MSRDEFNALPVVDVEKIRMSLIQDSLDFANRFSNGDEAVYVAFVKIEQERIALLVVADREYLRGCEILKNSVRD